MDSVIYSYNLHSKNICRLIGITSQLFPLHFKTPLFLSTFYLCPFKSIPLAVLDRLFHCFFPPAPFRRQISGHSKEYCAQLEEVTVKMFLFIPGKDSIKRVSRDKIQASPTTFQWNIAEKSVQK